MGRMSVRTEKTLRLVATSLIAAIFGITAVARESETLGYIAIGLVLAGILIGPLASRLLTRDGTR